LRAHQEVLSTKCYSFVKPPFFARIVGEVTGMGLVFAEGEEHKTQRKLLNGKLPESFWSRSSSL
jgi:cytochrome P450